MPWFQCFPSPQCFPSLQCFTSVSRFPSLRRRAHIECDHVFFNLSPSISRQCFIWVSILHLGLKSGPRSRRLLQNLACKSVYSSRPAVNISRSRSSSSSSSLREFALCQIHDVLRHGHVRGYTLDPSSRKTLCRAEPGLHPDRPFHIASKLPEIELKSLRFGLDVYEKPIPEGP